MKYILILFLSITTVFGKEHIKILKDSCKFPKVAIAILKHESANEKSRLATVHNNLFGFRGGKYAVGKTKGGYSVYNNKNDSALAYVYFEKRVIEKYSIKTREEYLNILNKIYAHDNNWKDKILKHLEL